MTEAQRVQEAIDELTMYCNDEYISMGDSEAKKALDYAISILRSYLHALQSGEVPEEKEICDPLAGATRTFNSGFNSCRSQMLPLIVARDRRLAELERREG